MLYYYKNSDHFSTLSFKIMRFNCAKLVSQIKTLVVIVYSNNHCQLRCMGQFHSVAHPNSPFTHAAAYLQLAMKDDIFQKMWSRLFRLGGWRGVDCHFCFLGHGPVPAGEKQVTVKSCSQAELSDSCSSSLYVSVSCLKCLII